MGRGYNIVRHYKTNIINKQYSISTHQTTRKIIRHSKRRSNTTGRTIYSFLTPGPITVSCSESLQRLLLHALTVTSCSSPAVKPSSCKESENTNLQLWIKQMKWVPLYYFLSFSSEPKHERPYWPDIRDLHWHQQHKRGCVRPAWRHSRRVPQPCPQEAPMTGKPAHLKCCNWPSAAVKALAKIGDL